jgi:hypothetical protein
MLAFCPQNNMHLFVLDVAGQKGPNPKYFVQPYSTEKESKEIGPGGSDNCKSLQPTKSFLFSLFLRNKSSTQKI